MEINNIIEGIAVKLKDSFPGYTIYVDKVPQNFKQPSFLIQLLSMDHVRQIGKRWYVAPLFNVQYFTEEGKANLFNHSLLISQALQDITLLNGDKLLARGQNSQITDDILSNFMRYDFYLNDVQLKDYMESLQLDSRIVEGN